MQPIQTIGIIAKKHNAKAQALAEEVEAWLKARDVRSFQLEKNEDYSLKADLLQKTDLILVCGGDGTMINALKYMAGMDIPLAGINLGRVGFLLELSTSNWPQALDRALRKGIKREKRLALRCELERGGQRILSENATNEIVISRGGMARLIALNLSVDGERLLYLRADGLIIATPTGTTAYSSSAGGPLLHPSVDAYCATTICPFLNRLQPMVLTASAIFSAEIMELNAKTCLTVDGQSLCRLQGGDILHVQGVPQALTFGKFGVSGYFDKLRASGIVRDSPGENKS